MLRRSPFRWLTIALGLLALSTTLLAQENAPNPADDSGYVYRLGPGDTVNIRVFDEADLSGEYLLDEEGEFFYAFVGRVGLNGLTLAQAEERLLDTLRGDYLIEPRLSVRVATYRPFFIKGAISKPGSYPYQPGLTVSRAITLAGGLTERASDRKIYLVPDGGLQSDRRRVELDDLVRPGDSLTVEESFF